MKDYEEWLKDYIDEFPEAVHYPKLLLLEQYYDYRHLVEENGETRVHRAVKESKKERLPHSLTSEIQSMIEDQSNAQSASKQEFSHMKREIWRLVAISAILAGIFAIIFLLA